MAAPASCGSLGGRGGALGRAVLTAWFQGARRQARSFAHTMAAALVAVGLWFALFSLRIFFAPGWTTYVPIASPVFGSGPHWAGSRQSTLAILGHVGFGVVALACGLLQFDKTLRSSRPRIHRWTGRLYVASGLVMVATLQPLRARSGGFARPGDGPNRAMAGFIDVASLAWLASTATAVYQAAVRRDFGAHKRWAVTSLGVLLTPLAQRFTLLVTVPVCMGARLLVDAVVHGLPFWQSAWGAAPAAWTGAPSAPRVLSLEGYGIAENAGFAFSAWAGLCEMLLFAYLVAWSPEADGARGPRDSAEESGCEGAEAAPEAGGLLATFDFSIADSLRALSSARGVCTDAKGLTEAPFGNLARFKLSPCSATQSLGTSICRCIEALSIAIVVPASLVVAVGLTSVATAVMGAAIVIVILTWGLVLAGLACAAKSKLQSVVGIGL